MEASINDGCIPDSFAQPAAGHAAPEEGERIMFIGWAYLIAFLMTADGLLLALWAMDKDWHWPKRWKK